MELQQRKISKDDSRLDELLKLMTSGRYQEVVTFCSEFLRRKKSSAFEFVLGHALIRLGDAENGIPKIEKMHFKSVKDPYCLYRMGNLALETGHLIQAVLCYKKAVSYDKTFWEAFFNLGNTLKRLFKFQEASECYLKVMKLNPGMYDAVFNAGQVFETLKDFEKAQECYVEVLAHKKNDSEALSGLGRCHYQHSERILARECWDKAIEINPKSASAYNDIVNTHILNGEFDDAQIQLDAAIESGIEHETIYLNMGRILYIGSKEIELAQQVFEQGVEKYPRVPELWGALINQLIDKGQYDEAEEHLNSLFEAGMGIWYLKLAMTRVLFETGRLNEAEAIMAGLLELEPNNGMFNSSLLAFKTYNSRHTPDELFAAHKKYGALIEEGRQGILPTRLFTRDLNKRIKVGYVSPDFRDHATSRFMEPIIANHDREKFHITLYSQSKFVDATTNRLQDYSDDWCFTSGMDDLELAKSIQKDEIDILVDLAGHTPGNRLGAFAYHPAPIQASWVGYPFTTGMKSIDYYFSEPEMTPIDKTQYFVEKVEYLVFSETKYRLNKVSWLPEGIVINKALPYEKNKFITFGCFNRIEKLSDDIKEAWLEILHKVPTSRLFLKNRNFDSKAYREKYIDWFVDKGIQKERLQFEPSSSLKEYVNSFNEIDIGLDTYPYNGSTVSNDSLKMCVPFVTLCGETINSRVGAKYLAVFGFEHLVATDVGSYIERVVKAASNIDQLRDDRKTLYERTKYQELDGSIGPLEDVFVKILDNASEK